MGGLTLYGPATTTSGTGTGPGPKRTGLVAFNCDTVHATDLSFFLDQEGVAVRTGELFSPSEVQSYDLQNFISDHNTLILNKLVCRVLPLFSFLLLSTSTPPLA